MVVVRLLYIAIALCCSACMHKKQDVDRAVIVSDDVTSLFPKRGAFDERMAECQEALLIDIPIPLYTQRLPVTASGQCGGQVVLGYYSAIEPDSLVALYQDQMERYGWNLVRSFLGSEMLLHFEKPARACSISIRPHSTFFGKSAGTDLVLYLEDSRFTW